MKRKKVTDTTYTCKKCGGRVIKISWLNHETRIYDDSEYECINCGNSNWGEMYTKNEKRMAIIEKIAKDPLSEV